MKAALLPARQSGLQSMNQVRKQEKAGVRAANEEASLLGEIGRLGGDDRKRGAEGALEMFHRALTDMVKEKPMAYGEDDDSASQKRVVSHLIECVRNSFLTR